MKGTVLYGPGDVRFEDRETPKIVEPTDAVIRIAATCVCGSDLWPYRGLQPIEGPTPMGHEYCGIVEEMGRAVQSLKPGQFVVGSFATSDNTCPNCRYGYQSSCIHREFMTRAQAPVLRVPRWYRTLNRRLHESHDRLVMSLGREPTHEELALFLRRFVTAAKAWLHCDIFAWNQATKPGRPEGGECQGARALYHLIAERYG